MSDSRWRNVGDVDDSGDPRPDDDAVREQLTAMLSTARFQRSPRSSAILRFIVDEALAGRPYQINARTIVANAFEPDQEEGTLSEAAVRVAVGRLRRALQDHYREHETDPVVITIPTGSYVPRLVQRPSSRPSIAVIVFDDLGADPVHAHTRFGVADALAGRLAAEPHLRVVGALDPIDLTTRAPQTAAGFDYILSGSVRSVDGAIRVAVQLQAGGGEVVWSRSVDATPVSTDLLGFEDDVVNEVAGALGDYTGIINRHRAHTGAFTDDLATNEAWSRFLQFMPTLETERFWTTLESFEQAVDDESDARMQAVLSHLYCTASALDPGKAEEYLDGAVHWARRSLAQAPNDPHASWAMGLLQLLRGHHDLARVEFDRLPTLPAANPSLLYGAGLGKIWTGGPWAAGMALIERAIERHPAHPGSWMIYPAHDRYLRGDYVGALETARSVNLPSGPIGAILRAAALVRLGRPAPAKEELHDVGIDSTESLATSMTAMRAALLAPPEIADRIERDALSALAAKHGRQGAATGHARA